ncbi:porin [Cytophaga aurantiaca]|uniref:porin n=1 Tax=Cytophaga aurantiaca TaxID=29530 RepID=UPI00036FE840|nr:porin [Cytophaga aurantiaca]
MQNIFKVIYVSVCILIGATHTLQAQVTDQTQRTESDTIPETRLLNQMTNHLTISGYIEAYYGYDFSNTGNHTRPSFVYSYNRHNEVNINLGFIKAAYATDKVRANIALMTGTYANANLAAEPGVLKNIFEANVGAKISKRKNLWVDAGVFASHIGFESAIGKDCWNLTRSMLADNSPYYESGVKVSYTSDNEKWFVSGLVLNGWQRIQRVDGNNTPALGHQLTYKPTSKITLNSSSFVGSDTPDSSRQMRYFHNLYGIFQLHEKFGIILGFDIGVQQKSKGSSAYNTWFSPVVQARYNLSSRSTIAARLEYYSDVNGVIISTGTPHGFQTYGYSLNLDYKIAENVVWRTEGKVFSSTDKIFILDNEPNNNNYVLTTSLAVSF